MQVYWEQRQIVEDKSTGQQVGWRYGVGKESATSCQGLTIQRSPTSLQPSKPEVITGLRPCSCSIYRKYDRLLIQHHRRLISYCLASLAIALQGAMSAQQ